MKRMLVLIMGALFAFTIPTPSGGAEEVTLKEVVVTATRVEEPLDETTSSVTVITSEDIERTNAVFAVDVLRLVPSINVTQSGGDGKQVEIFMRGGASGHTLVMIDGVKVNSTTTGAFDFGNIAAADIERIEIVKGPQSTVYGSEAMAGVINIITKKGKGRPVLSLTAEAGSLSTYLTALSLSGSSGALHYRINTSYKKTDGISAAKSGTEPDGYENAAISFRLGFSPSDRVDLELSGSHHYDHAEIDGFDFLTGTASDDPNFLQQGHQSLMRAKATVYMTDRWEQSLTASALEESLVYSDPDTAFNNFTINTGRKTVDWQHNIFPGENVTITAGVEHRVDEGENVGNFEETVDNTAVYLSGKLKALTPGLVLNGGLRYDEHETAGAKTTYRMGAVYSIQKLGASLRASVGTGFRSPSMNDLFFPFYGDPTLLPEETTAWEVGVTKAFLDDKASVGLTYFSQDYENLIQTDTTTFTAANIADAEVRGIEALAELKLTDAFKVSAGYTRLKTEDLATGESLPRRPDDKLSLRVDYSKEKLKVSATFIHTGESYDSIGGETVEPYSLVNLSGSYGLGGGVTLIARAENLLDEDYEEVRGYGTKGFSIYGGLRYAR